MDYGQKWGVENGLKWIKVDNKWVPMRDVVQVEPTDKNDEHTNLGRQNLIVFVIEPDNQSAIMNYNPIGMNFFNRFVAEENDQFEVYAFYRIKDWVEDEVRIEKAVQKYAEQSKRDKTDTNIVHFIWAGHIYDCDDILKTIKNEMARFGLKKGMVSFLQKHRFHCVTKEKYEELYEKGGQIDGSNMELSLGDDLEDFLNRIKNNEIHGHELGPGDNLINTFHLSLLSPGQKRKLAINHDDYHKTFHNHDPDVPKKEMAKSESKSKYAFSLCRRGTYIISPEILLPKERQDPLGWQQIVSDTGEILWEFTYEEEIINIETQGSEYEFQEASVPNPELPFQRNVSVNVK